MIVLYIAHIHNNIPFFLWLYDCILFNVLFLDLSVVAEASSTPYVDLHNPFIISLSSIIFSFCSIDITAFILEVFA
jgi:hypothetical protein